MPNSESFLLAEASIKHKGIDVNKTDFILKIMNEEIHFSIILGGKKGHAVGGLTGCKIQVCGLKSESISLEQFFQENPHTMFLLNGCTISGCIHTDYGECKIQDIPDDRIKGLDWEGVDYTIESHFKGNEPRKNSIQEYMMKYLMDRGARIVFNDDNAGESADIVAVFVGEKIRFEMVHCKYSKPQSGARLSDLYEVCGQAIVSLRYKWRPEELLKHMERRNGSGTLKGKRFYHGQPGDLKEIKKALKYSDVAFEFAIAQPGVKASSITPDMSRLLSSIYSIVVEMTETKFRSYFNNN